MTVPDTDIDPDGLLRRYLHDRRFLLALPRAVALQMLHPAIAAGMDHSRTPRRLWLHKRRTVPVLVRAAYDDRHIRPIVRFAHEDVKGTDDLGRRYHALDPDVFFFQHATYVDTLVTMIDVFVRRLEVGEKEALYLDSCAWYRRYGISDRRMPQDWAEFTDYFDDTCASVLARTPSGDRYRDQILQPRDWVQRGIPARVVRALLHPAARTLWEVDVGAAHRRALTAYATYRRLRRGPITR
ncbi:Uncharacterized protein conserved in bacteria [Rhodococcus rhodochrous]|uniref:oxygenase MpaB family protein n=1 Tax=Rhodococcus rhodochrous TaxID=1829 RepID=UPI000750ABED|nr:oxygenase MpaB family protein [Rhodococcus rhodochrous]MDO1485490.1 DUF2236 domain-containing protein [Rhodococcus rhodochrous]SNV19386.1 Uncharacterized protein conserved in bacteria [Rhodococcus rhodochrous]